MYNSTNLNNIFDFSSYPVKIITNPMPLLNKLYKNGNKTFPPLYREQLINPKDVVDHGVYVGYFLFNKSVRFNIKKKYPNNVILVKDNGGFLEKDFNNILKYIKLNKNIINSYNKISFKNIEYNSIHIRNTDCDIDSVKYMLDIKNINDFITNSSLPVFLASDNSKIINDIKNKYGDKILLSNTKYYNKDSTDIMNHQYGNLHQYGTINPDVLIEGIYDLLLLASAKTILIVNKQSKYSNLANFLCNNKEVLNKLLRI